MPFPSPEPSTTASCNKNNECPAEESAGHFLVLVFLFQFDVCFAGSHGLPLHPNQSFKGTVGFNYDLAVVPNLQTIVRAKNVYGQDIYLPEFLKFGVVFADTEAELTQKLANRDLAEKLATTDLSSYTSEPDHLQAEGEAFVAVIVRMPKEVGNVANYRDNNPPSIELGITVQAMQEGMN